jgi:hypothetical protein
VELVSEHLPAFSKEWISTVTRNLMLLSLSKPSLLSGKRQNFPWLFEPASNFIRFRLFPKKVELQALMKYYDVDGDGNISYDEFLRGLRYAIRRYPMLEGNVTVSLIVEMN